MQTLGSPTGAFRTSKGCLRQFKAGGGKLVSMVANTIGPMIMLLGHAIVVGLTYTYFTEPIIPADVPNYIYVPWTCLGLWLVFNLFFNWHMTAFAEAGSPPFPKGGLEAQEFPLCQKCNRLKPPRTHHCSICNKCVLAMDHHCPWMNNCIGFNNYKFFFLFLMYTTAALLFFMFSIFLNYPIIRHTFPRMLRVFYEESYIKEAKVPFNVSMCSVIAGSVFGGVVMLFGWHCFLAITGQTTIEFQSNKTKSGNMFGTPQYNDFDLGPAKNWEMLFGKWKYPLGWAMPSFSKPRGDGMHWPTVKTAYGYNFA